MRLKFDNGIYIQKIEFDTCDHCRIDFKNIEENNIKDFFSSISISESITERKFEKVWGKLQKISKSVFKDL